MQKKQRVPFHTILLAIMLTSVLVVCFGMGGTPSALAEEGDPPDSGNPYFSSTTVVMDDGKEISKVSIGGPATPPAGFARASVTLPETSKEMGIVTLTVPAYDWSFGCSATSGSMIAAYWDRNGFPNMYTGPTGGGVMPMDSSSWGTFTDSIGDTYGQCPLTASRDGLDGRVGKGSIDDYWVAYMTGARDPFITGNWTEHTWGTAIGDYMKTSQSNYKNVDGSTSFYYEPSGIPLTCSDMEMYEIDEEDGNYGRKLFYEARGYTVTDCFTQLTDNEDDSGFTFAQYKAEIDAGRPVMIHVTGHTMVGVGYDDTTQKVYLHDTWGYSTTTMTWGGSYSGMTMWGISIVNLAGTSSGTLTVSPAGTGSGTVTSSPAGISCGTDCTEDFPANTVVTLTAKPKWNSTFAGWSGACSGTGTCNLTMSASKNVTATFNLKTFTLTVSKAGTGSGTVSSTPPGIDCGADCSEAYAINTSVTLAAAPSIGSNFTGWSGACTGTGTCVVSMTAAKSVTATFAVTATTNTLTVSKNGTGSGSVTSSPVGISCGTDCSEAYPSTTTVTLSALPRYNSTFAGWSGACTGTGACVVTMDAARSVTATFNLKTTTTYTLTVGKTGTGSGTVTSLPTGINCGSDCSEAYASGTSVTLTAVASTGSTFTGWSGACTGTGTCTVTMTAAKSVTATFTLSGGTSYTLTVTKTGTGAGKVSSSPLGISCGTDCSQLYSSGTLVILTATPWSSSTFTGWSGACSGSGSCAVTMSAAKTVTATFTLKVVWLDALRNIFAWVEDWNLSTLSWNVLSFKGT